MTTSVKLSAAPIDWGVAGLVDGNPEPAALLDCVANAGYTGCELGTHGYFGFTSTEILSLVRATGIAGHRELVRRRSVETTATSPTPPRST